MTIEAIEFRCRTCGHILGEEEYIRAYNKHEKDVQEIREEERVKYQRENQQLRIENQKLNEDFENRVNVGIQSKLDGMRSEENEKYQQEIESLKSQYESQYEQAKSEAIKQALNIRDDKWRQKEEEYKLQMARIQKYNGDLENELASIPPERKGTSGERILMDDLHDAFSQDDLVYRTVGEEMPDIIQTIVIDNKERIITPILWDMKTGDIGTKDIEKAKRYKEKYNTDYCILVTSRQIEAKYTNNGIEGLMGSVDGITLLHKSIASEMAREFRNFIIKETRLTKNNNGRASKQSSLYEYITSPARLRKIQDKIKYKEELEKSIRRQQGYNIKVWKKQMRLIEKSFKLDSADRQAIREITQQDQLNEDRPKEDKEE